MSEANLKTTNTLARKPLNISGVILFILFFSSQVLAQSFSNFGTTNTFSSAPVSSGGTMSTEEYKAMINNLSKQNQDNLTSKVTQQYKSSAPTQPVVSTPATTVTSPQTAPVSQTTQTTTTTVAPTAPVQTTAPAALPATAPSQPNQTYTGFMAPANDQNKNNSSTDKSSGWQIKY